MAKYENYYVDTAFTNTIPGAIEILVDKLGADRVLFGSDMPIVSPYIRLGQLLSANICDADMEKILGLNAARLYGIPISYFCEHRLLS